MTSRRRLADFGFRISDFGLSAGSLHRLFRNPQLFDSDPAAVLAHGRSAIRNWPVFIWVFGLLLPAPAQTPPPRYREILKKIEVHARPLLVGVEIALRKSTRMEKVEKAMSDPDVGDRRLELLKEIGQTVDGFAVRIGADGTYLMQDPAVKLDEIASITLIDGEGKRHPAKRVGILRNYAGLVLRAEDAPGNAPVAEFTPALNHAPSLGSGPARPIAIGEDYYAATLGKPTDDRWQIGAIPFIASSVLFHEGGGWALDDHVPEGALIYDGDGRPVGVALDERLWIDPDGRSSWVGTDIVRDEVLGAEALEARIKALEEKSASFLPEIRIAFREEETEAPRRRAPPGEESRELVVYGVLLDGDGTILVPESLDRETVQKIESIHVREGELRQPVVFLGSFQSIGALLLRCEALKGRAPAAAAAEKDPARGRAYLACRAEFKFGRRKTSIEHQRVFRHVKGLKNRPKWAVPDELKPGSLLLDLDGGLLGVVTDERQEQDPDEAALGREGGGAAASRYLRRYYGDDASAAKLFGMSELQEVIAAGGAAFDPLAVPLSREEARRLVWLGVEYQGLNKDLAEILDVQKATKDGKQGLLLAHVYPGSPAARLGLVPGDLLLSIRVEGRPGVLELALPEGRDPFDPSSWGGRFRRGEASFPWRSRRNFLATLLTQIGAGRKVSIGYLHEKQEKTAGLTLETAPPDFASAPKIKDDVLGLTVRDLTYEVAYFQRIDLASGGAVVAKIEPGSACEVAKLGVSDLIRRVNAYPIQDIAAFAEAVKKCRAAGLATLTLEVLNLGLTRFVDVRIP